MKRQKTYIVFFILASLLVCRNAEAQSNVLFIDFEKKDTSTPGTIFDYLSNDSITYLQISTDVKKLLKGKWKKNPKYQKAILKFTDQHNITQTWNVKIRVRGNRRKEYCNLPPVKIDFKKEHLKDIGLQKDHDKLKVVNDCQKGSKCDAYLLREYLAYRIFNIFTEKSFRVKLIQISYVDTKGKKDFGKNYAFIIENPREMAQRLGGKLYEIPFFDHRYAKNEITALVDIFQYMIGNTDYRINVHHNIKMIRVSGSDLFFPIPYDFDYSGLVNTNYSTPAKGLTTKDVRTRVFMGLCEEEEVWIEAFQIVKDHEKEIIDLINNFEHLKGNEKKYVLQYVNSFFKKIKKPSAYHHITQRCME